MTLTERQQAVLAGVAAVEERGEDGPDPHQILIGRLYEEVYEDTGEEQPDLDQEAREVLESLVQLGLVEHRPPTKSDPELTAAGRRVHDEGLEAVEFEDESGDGGESESGGGLLGKLGGLFW
jgi:hypothetical protein